METTSLPNVILIMTDQQRADLRAGEGFPMDTMPVLDQLGREGVSFGKAYTSTPICAPARCSLFDGRFPSSHGIRMNYDASRILHEKDLVEVFRDLGYRRMVVGKNHSHLGPTDFDACRRYGHASGEPRTGLEQQDRQFDLWMTHLVHWVSQEPTPFPVECQYPVRIVDDSIALLSESAARKPFFLWMTFPEPHNPYQVPDPYFSLFQPDGMAPRTAGPEAIGHKNDQWRFMRELTEHYHPDCDDLWRRYRSNYCGMLRLIDDQLGRFFQFLDSAKLRENTLIVYLTDHGDFVGEYGLFRKGVGLPECLIRIPFIWNGLGIDPRLRLENAHVSIVDVFPTLCEVLGVDIPDGVQGRSLWPILNGAEIPVEEFGSIYVEHGLGVRAARREEVPFDEETCYIEAEGQRRSFHELNNYTTSGTRKMVRQGKWKLISDLDYGEELYDLETDPAETNNRANHPECRDIREQLTMQLLRWTMRTQDTLPLSSDYGKTWRHSANKVRRGVHGWDFEK